VLLRGALIPDTAVLSPLPPPPPPPLLLLRLLLLPLLLPLVKLVYSVSYRLERLSWCWGKVLNE
jgi:hypothetical protein